MGLIPGPGTTIPKLNLCTASVEPLSPRTHMLQQEKPQGEAPTLCN